MIEYGDRIYYIDLDALEKVLELKPSTSTDKLTENSFDTKVLTTYLDGDGKITGQEVNDTFTAKTKEINVIKLNTINTLMDVILNDMAEEGDETLGADNELAKTSFAVKIAFNTLYKYKIIKEI